MMSVPPHASAPMPPCAWTGHLAICTLPRSCVIFHIICQDEEIKKLKAAAEEKFTPLSTLIDGGEDIREAREDPSNRLAVEPTRATEEEERDILAQARLQASRDAFALQLKNEIATLKTKLERRSDVAKEADRRAREFKAKVSLNAQRPLSFLSHLWAEPGSVSRQKLKQLAALF